MDRLARAAGGATRSPAAASSPPPRPARPLPLGSSSPSCRRCTLREIDGHHDLGKALGVEPELWVEHDDCRAARARQRLTCFATAHVHKCRSLGTHDCKSSCCEHADSCCAHSSSCLSSCLQRAPDPPHRCRAHRADEAVAAPAAAAAPLRPTPLQRLLPSHVGLRNALCSSCGRRCMALQSLACHRLPAGSATAAVPDA
jgi:hypothetical protein